MLIHSRQTLILLAAVFAVGGFAHAADEPPLTFERDIRPILKAYCIDCHGGEEEHEGELDLRLRRFIVKGGESGPAIVPGKAGESLLLKKIKSGKMPPSDKKVPADQAAMIERWIASGATAERQEPESLPPGIDITPRERAYWAFQPLNRPQPPAVASGERASTPIDAFILAKLRTAGRTFAPEADRRTLILRASFDLTGLPPSMQEIDAFINDKSPNAYEQMIDRLLASPNYGERWARHWLDVAGYADSEGNGNDDAPRPHAYKYRDYVIRSFNAGKPLNQFIIEQLAGDELVPRPWVNLSAEQLDKLVATGFLRNAPDATVGGGDPMLAANQVVTDTIKIIGSSLYGLSIACAQCHDHRYDPIPQSDYFRLRAVFEPALDPRQWRRPPQRMLSLFTDADRAKVAQVNAEAQKLREARSEKERRFLNEVFERELPKFSEALRAPLREAYHTPDNKRTAEQKKLLADNPSANISGGVLYQYDQAKADELKKDQEQIAAKEAERPIEDFVRVLDEVPGHVPVTKLHHRGDPLQPKGEVKPGDLTIAAPDGQRFEIADRAPDRKDSTGRRLALARHLTSGKQPLLPRVLANRIWLHHFGRGIVDTPGDFGALGVAPTHPELLDWLATELIERGWSLKQMHRLIMTSAVYRQSSRPADRATASSEAPYDRFPLHRLDAEIIRDRMLGVAGVLDLKQLGPAIPVALDPVGQVVAENDSPRRSIYLQVQRSKPIAFLTTFDQPTPAPNCERRIASTSSPQALMLMNSEFVLKRAGELAARVRRETTSDFAAQLVSQIPGALAPLRPADAWTFGTGAFDAASQRVTDFSPLPHFTGAAWQGGPALPDAKLGWAILHAGGGHTGDNPRFAAVRRWTAPRAGKVAITGSISHPSKDGDGVRGRIVSSRAGVAGTWTVRTNEQKTQVDTMEVQPGDTIDFVTDCIENINCDSFAWGVRLTLTTTGDKAGETTRTSTWDSAADFHGPLASAAQQIAYAWQTVYLRPITAGELNRAMEFFAQQLDTLGSAKTKGDHDLIAMTNLCQQLISSNEFLYVD